ncbi:hypothetical protein [Streptomyces chryseus]|uniref:hypothetical protein n=1 Tax=Streptomyces chryseus TaxID=68186 RepID=UPI0019B2B221|nr:hypothetical protein [Streptomyces chryseus]GGX48202.1 hypothetical protein GCM10010353_72730 [Streptomyces chryseus]
MKIMVGGLAVGVGFGAVTSLVNAFSSPYGELGAPLTGTVWAKAAKVLSLLIDAGWSWAALAVAMGWLAGTRTQGALVGALALMAATVAYYLTDAFVWGADTDIVDWLVVGLPLGLLLGAVGAAIGRPGLIGLLAALTVPVGAAVQMVVLPPRPHLTLTPAIVLAEAIAWTAAALGAGWAVYRFRAEKRAVGAV